MNVELEESDRQAIILALAKLSLSRPGWHPACLSRIAEQLGGRTMYEEFRSHGPDQGSVSIRAFNEIQRAHDILWAVRMGEVPPVLDVDGVTAAHAALDVLCWVLAHNHNQAFADNLAKLEAELAGLGFVLTEANAQA